MSFSSLIYPDLVPGVKFRRLYRCSHYVELAILWNEFSECKPKTNFYGMLWHQITKNLDIRKFGPCLSSADRGLKIRPYISKTKEKFKI